MLARKEALVVEAQAIRSESERRLSQLQNDALRQQLQSTQQLMQQHEKHRASMVSALENMKESHEKYTRDVEKNIQEMSRYEMLW